MYEAFESLPEPKQEAVRAAALEEFVAHGYGGASTNAITRRAGISKGLLFHYFGSKKNLFLYLVDFVTERLFDYFNALAHDRPRDIFDRISQWSLLKFRMIQDNLLYYRFLFEAIVDRPKGLEKEMAEYERRTTARGYQILFEDLDLSVFRPDIDPKKALDVIVMVNDGLSRRYLEIMKKDPNPDRGLALAAAIRRDLDEYQALLRKVLCPPEADKQ